MKKLVAEFNARSQYHDGGNNKHHPVLCVYIYVEQVTVLEDAIAHIMLDIPDAPSFNRALDAQEWMENWLDSPTSHKWIYGKID